MDQLEASLESLAWADEPAARDQADQVFTIGQLAREFGVTFRTLRFYESRGFVTPRRQGTTRLYRQADRDRIALVLKAKRLGFTLREINLLLASQQGTPDSLRLSRRQCTDQINLLERQKREIESALAELRREYSSYYRRRLESGELGSI
jgi:DNA-binding transcriptional MerR regulator